MMRLRQSYISALLVLMPMTVGAQSLLDRPPNLSGNWTGGPGTLYFNFLHRFTASDAPERKVSNVPTFMLATGLPKRFLAGFNYSTNSTLAPGFPNEWEVFARWAPLAQDYGAPFDLGGQIGFNNAADGVDGEVSLARRFGITRVMAAGRALSDPLEEGNVRYAVAGGAVIRLGTYVALAGDVASLTSRDSSERIAWGAGVHIAIPLTPHSLSLQVTNTQVGTMQGASRGSSNLRYGFEFTIPLTLRRYFGSRGDTADAAAVASTDPPADPNIAAGAGADTASAPVTTSPPVLPSTPPAGPTSPVRPPTDTARRPATNPTPRRTQPAAPARTPSAGAPRSAPARTPARPTGRVVRMGIKNINYLQPRLQVTVGTTVAWTNNDPLAHTVTANDKTFNSGLIQPGKTYRYTFTKAGTYNYFCIPHPFMKGTVVVRAE